MKQVIIRNLEDHVVETLKCRAERKGTSLEQELRDIVTADAMSERQEFVAKLAAFRANLGDRNFPDMTAMIREDRDR
jgi:plasmid stability protein